MEYKEIIEQIVNEGFEKIFAGIENGLLAGGGLEGMLSGAGKGIEEMSYALAEAIIEIRNSEEAGAGEEQVKSED